MASPEAAETRGRLVSSNSIRTSLRLMLHCTTAEILLPSDCDPLGVGDADLLLNERYNGGGIEPLEVT